MAKAKTKSKTSPKKKESVKKKQTIVKKSSPKIMSKKEIAKKPPAKKIDSKKAVGKNGLSSPASKKTAPVSKPKVIFRKTETVTTLIEEKKIRKFKPNKKTKYTIPELRHFREIILKERKAILESAKANMDALVDKDSGEYKGDDLTYSTHMAEQGTDEMEREKNYLFVQRDEKYLGYLQDALMRIDQGTYGICVDCRDDPKNLCKTCPLVQKERLELVPITQHCIECKNLRG